MTPAQARESEQVTSAFHVALIALGAQSSTDSLRLWEQVPAVPNSANAAQGWLDTTVRYVKRRRLRARDLALAYFRYQRALATGQVVALPGMETPPRMTLPQLKRLFAEQLDGVGTEELSTTSLGGDDAPLEVVSIPGMGEALAKVEIEAERQLRDNLMNLGPRNQDKKIERVPLNEAVDAGRKKAHAEAGRRQAATVARSAMNGARGPLYLVSDADKSAMGWVRISRTGTPCGFCAMLISRQVQYRSHRTAMFDENGDLYHDNCKCIAIPVFSIQQYERSELFALNRYYAEMWPKVTRGHSGDAALAVWRKFIREQMAKSQAQVAAA